ncbi:MAG: YdeI/OmpD-associated family protein [Bacteroidetes bacterium]|nr:YdeI/OmpD-associated family protein [Bacteroidota bacterium]
MNPKVDFFFNKASKWQEEYENLRTIILDCGLTEELKWGVPCYTFQKSNIVLIHGFKEYCALLFHKGVLLKDENNLLIQQTENVQAARQIRFKNLGEIIGKEPVLKAFIHEAIEVEKAGLKIDLKKTTEYNMPEEFQKRLEENKKLKTAFEGLTPGRQRGYILYFTNAKQSKTRELRIEKHLEKILSGKGLDD